MLSYSPKSWSGLLFRRLISVLLFLNMLATPLSAWAGTSVNIQTGYFSYSTTDLAFGGLYPLALSRDYQNSSDDGGQPFAGPFGLGTSLGMWSMVLAADANGNLALIMPATNATTQFNCSGSTCTNAEQKSYLKGVFTTSGSQAILQTEDGTNYKFEYFPGIIASGKLLSITDRFGKTTTLNYIGNNLSSVVTPNGRGIALYYTNTSFPSQITSARLFDNNNPQLFNDNYFVSYEYDGAGNLAKFYNVLHNRTVKGIDSNGQIIDRTAYGITTYTYDGLKQLVSITNPRGVQSTSIKYDGCDINTNPYCSNRRIISQTKPGALTNTTSDDVINYYSYGFQCNKTACRSTSTFVKDTLNDPSRQLTYNYSSGTGFMTSQSNAADASTTAFSYDGISGQLNNFTNALGYKTSYTYDLINNLYYHPKTAIESNINVITTYSFTAPFGQLASAKDANNYTSTFTYNGATGLLSQVYIPLPQTDYFDSYNSFGQLLQATDGKGRINTYHYASPSQDLDYSIDPDGLRTNYFYDSLSRLTSTYLSSASSDVVSTSYDYGNRVTQITAPGGRITKFTYDDNSNVTSVTAPNGVMTIYTYDAMDRVSSRKHGSYTEYYYYNNLNQIVKAVDAKGQQTQLAYDSKGRLYTTQYNDGKIVTYTYDKLDRVMLITDSSDSSGAKNVAYTYYEDNSNIPGPKTVTTAPNTSLADTLTYNYDPVGNLISISRSGVNLLQYGYYQDNSLKTATLVGQNGQSSIQVGVSYNAAGEPETVKYGYNDISNTSNVRMWEGITYNPQGDISGLTFGSSQGASELRNVQYGYDYAYKGYLTLRTETGQSVVSVASSQTYGYDQVGELTTTNTPVWNLFDNYDLDGNPTQMLEPCCGSGTTTYEPGTNRMTSAFGWAIVNDANGNMTKTTNPSFPTTPETLTWNARNQLTSYYSGSLGYGPTYSYDALGRRLSKTINGVTTKFVYAGAQVIEEVSNGVTKRYLIGLGLDSVLASRQGSVDEFLLKDALNGSVMAVVDPTSQTVKTGYGYSPFGTTFKSNNNSNNNLLFTGRELDIGATVYYFRNRYYNAGFQRFLSEDPTGFGAGDTNLYRYISNNPIIGNDPTGLTPPAPVNIKVDLQIDIINFKKEAGSVTDALTLVPGFAATSNLLRDNGKPPASNSIGSGRSFSANINNSQYQGVMIAKGDACNYGYFCSKSNPIGKYKPGTWIRSNGSMSARARSYQTRITGRTGYEYERNGVRFDGIGKNGRLLDAKGPGYTQLLTASFGNSVLQKLLTEATRQQNAAGVLPIEWHFAEAEAAEIVQQAFNTARIFGIRIIVTPP